MKKVLLTAMVFASVATFAAQTEKSNLGSEIVNSELTETAIKIEELPEAVKKTLSGETYAQWKPISAFLVKEGEKEHYKIELTKDEAKQTLNFDKDGHLLK